MDSSTNRTGGWRRNEGPQRSTSRQELEGLGLRNFIETLLNVLLDQVQVQRKGPSDDRGIPRTSLKALKQLRVHYIF